jgi:cytochrome c
MILHLPIGMLVGLGLMEAVAVLRRQGPSPRLLVLVVALSAVLGAASGWVLHEEPDYGASDVLQWHEWLGIGTAVASLLCFFLRMCNSTRGYRLALLLSLGLMAPAGHLGGQMTHGKGFLLEPLLQKDQPVYIPPPKAEYGPTLANYTDHISPLLQARCVNCHGSRKSKGELRLDSVEAILAGGENGQVFNLETPQESEMIRRLHLPLEHEEHMPPEQKVQPSKEEIELLAVWIEAGAPFEQEFALADGVALPEPPTAEPTESEPEDAATDGPKPAPVQALTALRNQLVHVQLVQPGSVELWVDFAAPAASITDADVQELLAPLSDFIAELSLARTQVTDESLQMIAVMPKLTRLDLRQTAVSDAGLVWLRGHPNLSELILSRTQVTDAASETLAQLPGLAHLWIWDTPISAEGLTALRESLPQVVIDAGDLTNAVAMETEGELSFTSDAPLVDGPAGDESTTTQAEVGGASTGEISATQKASLLSPINSLCPVTDKAIDPQYTVLFEGRVIGFCCPNCPKTFWLDPASYLAKLPK